MDATTLAAQLMRPTGEQGREVGDMMNKSNALMYRSTLAQLAIAAGERVLEIGMGNGPLCEAIVSAAPGVHYTGCDFSEVMVEEAGRLNAALVESGRVRFLCVPAHTLPFGDHTFHRAVTLNTVYFWEQPERELAEVRRVLVPGGRLTLALRLKESLRNHPFGSFGHRLYDRDDIVPVVLRSGYRVVGEYHEHEPEKEFNGVPVRVENLVLTCERV